jgi:hypothetical protein
VKAALRTFKPREAKLVKPKPRFKRQHFISNMNQVGDLVAKVVQAKHFVKSCFEWESYPRTICAFSVCYAVIITLILVNL